MRKHNEMVQEAIVETISRADQLCAILTRSQKFFFFGFLALTLTAPLALMASREVVASGLGLTAVLFVAGIVSDFLGLYEKVWKTSLGKALLLLSFALITALAYGAAKQAVNLAVGFDPQVLSRSVTVAAILLVPATAFVVLFSLFFLLFLVAQLYLVFVVIKDAVGASACLRPLQARSHEPYPFATCLLRILFIYPIAAGALWASAEQIGPSYGSFIEKGTERFVYHFEALEASECEKEPEEKVIRLSGSHLIIAEKRKDGIHFTPGVCQYRRTPNKAMQPTPQSGAADG